MKWFTRNLLLLAATFAPAGFAQESILLQAKSRLLFCDAGALKGHYAVTLSGTRPAPFVLPAFPGVAPGTIEQVTGVFILIFDGVGAIRMGDNPTVKGAYSGLFPDKAGSGTYTVNADCSGSFTVSLPQLPAPLVNNMVITSGGKEFRAVVVSPQALMISVAATIMN